MSSRLQCYNPDGSITAPDQIPCASNNDHTHCCQQGATCLSNGLCLVQWDTSINTGTCTDPSWKADRCFQSCLVPRLDTISTLYKCTDNNFCCSGGGNTTNCCNDPGNIFFKISSYAQVENGTAFVSGYNVAPNSIINAAEPTSTSSTAPSTTSCPAQTGGSNLQAPPSPGCSSDKTKIGVGVGVGVGVPLLALAIAFFVLWYRERKQRSAAITNTPQTVPLPYGIAEADARYAIHEMPSTSVGQESSESTKSRPKRSWGRSTRS